MDFLGALSETQCLIFPYGTHFFDIHIGLYWLYFPVRPKGDPNQDRAVQGDLISTKVHVCCALMHLPRLIFLP